MLYESKVSCMSHKQSIQMPMTTRILEYKVQVQHESSIILHTLELEAAMVVVNLDGMSAI